MAKKQGSEPAAPSPDPAAGNPPAGAAPKYCPSCGKGTATFRQGKAAFCDECRHVFDAEGQGRPADFMDRLDRVEELARNPRDARVDRIDQLVGSLTERFTGERQTIETIDPDDPHQQEQARGLLGGLGPLSMLLGPMFRRRPAPRDTEGDPE